MKLNTILATGGIIAEMKAATQDEAVKELLDVALAGCIDPATRSVVEADIAAHEAKVGANVGWGLALPHSITAVTQKAVAAVGRSPHGIEWKFCSDKLDSKGNVPVRLVALLVLPHGHNELNRAVHKYVGQLLHGDVFYKEMLAAPDAEAMYTLLRNKEEGTWAS